MAEGLAHLGASASFGEAARLLAHFTGTTVGEATARRHTEAAGAAWVQLEQAAVERLEADPAAAVAAPSGPTVQQGSVDGVFVPVVGGEWREVKLLAIGEVGRGVAGGPGARPQARSSTATRTGWWPRCTRCRRRTLTANPGRLT